MHETVGEGTFPLFLKGGLQSDRKGLSKIVIEHIR